MRRVTVAIIGIGILLTASMLLQLQRTTLHHIAAAMQGEQWYRIQLQADHVGFMYNRNYRDHLGRWHFISTTHFQLEANAPNTLNKHLTFAAAAPHALLHARYSNADRSEQVQVDVTAADRGYAAEIRRSGQQRAEQIELDWQFGLHDFLAFEHWLVTERPAADAQYVIDNLDFERLRVQPRTYRVVEHNDEGYLVENNAPLAASQTQLDRRMRPLRLSMAGIFNVSAATEAEAVALNTLNQKRNYLFAVDQRLKDHTALAELHLRLNGAAHPGLPRELKLTHNPVISLPRQARSDQFSGEELRFPITHPEIQALVQRSMSGDAGNTIAQLVHTAHTQIRYTENQPAGSVLAALREGRGECTDFADLFTTLARAAGFPARNVYGLAYKDGPQPAFMFHAWNEVFSDGRWQAVDPTWNQVQVDASHIPLSENQAALMMLANNTGGVSFSVLGAEYF